MKRLLTQALVLLLSLQSLTLNSSVHEGREPAREIAGYKQEAIEAKQQLEAIKGRLEEEYAKQREAVEKATDEESRKKALEKLQDITNKLADSHTNATKKLKDLDAIINKEPSLFTDKDNETIKAAQNTTNEMQTILAKELNIQFDTSSPLLPAVTAQTSQSTEGKKEEINPALLLSEEPQPIVEKPKETVAAKPAEPAREPLRFDQLPKELQLYSDFGGNLEKLLSGIAHVGNWYDYLHVAGVGNISDYILNTNLEQLKKFMAQNGDMTLKDKYGHEYIKDKDRESYIKQIWKNNLDIFYAENGQKYQEYFSSDVKKIKEFWAGFVSNLIGIPSTTPEKSSARQKNNDFIRKQHSRVL